MKSINAIRIKLCALACMILLPHFDEYYPLGSGWVGFCMLMLVCGLGIYTGCFITDFLIEFKKWWKE